MTEQRLALGKQGEDLAVAYLQRLGYRILARNYRTRLGEIDVIADDGGTLVFIEVKSRVGTTFDRSYEAVTDRKQRQLSKVALEYTARHDLQDRPARFDVVGVLFEPARKLAPGPARVELVKNAFDLCYGT
ncbi:MAG: YraN family protein [Deltaproteobacteria bacterium RIFOXYD12_FULL_57_12]|nr:MAG: YraN family protein [Deltaproteobacteria bacterium RIFOXYD12_FULL_57_12]